MTRGSSPWSDPAVDAGFAAAYEPYAPVQERRTLLEEPPGLQVPEIQVLDPAPSAVDAAAVQPEHQPVTAQDLRAEAEDVAARPVLPTGRRARAPQPARLSPRRAVAGAAVSVAGVALGIGTLLWVSDDPSQGPGPAVQVPAAAEQDAGLDPFASQPEGETAPVDPVEPVAPPAAVPPPAPAPVAPAPVVEAPPVPSVVVPVTVLNNSRIPGLADRGAAQFEAEGWPVAETGNYRGRLRTSTVYYPAGQEAAAREFVRRFPGVQRVLPRPDNLPGRGLTVVLTRDFVS